MRAARFGTYRTGGHDEPWLARGPLDAPQVLIVPPLFEEANRCRALIAEMQRLIADEQVGSKLIDLPGTGDSERALGDIELGDWQQAVSDAAAAIGPDLFIATMRGGALAEGNAKARAWWRFSPVDGAALVRDLDRAQQIADKRDGIAGNGVRAGYPLASALVAQLGGVKAEPRARLRTVRLATEAAEADGRVTGPPLWRRPEPEQDLALAGALAADLIAWLRACDA